MSKMPTREAYGKALVNLGKDNDFLVLDADLAEATKTMLFKETYPERFFDMGISEGDMMTTAAGMAAAGKKVFASTFAIFAAGRAYEQIRNSIAYPNLPVVIGATHGGVMIGEDGASHQAIEDIALMRVIPNMTVLVPCDEQSTYAAVKAALNHNGPVYLRAGRGAADDVYDSQPDFTIGKGNVIADGTDLTIIAIGDMVSEALKAKEMLKDISVAVIDMASVKPIDVELVQKYAAKTGKIITAEDHSVIGGLGGAVAEIIAKDGNAKMRSLGLNDCFGRSGTRDALQAYFNLNAQGIVDLYKTF